MTENHSRALREIVLKRCPELSDRVETAGVRGLFRGERLVIVDALANELMESGFDKSHEPTPRGLEIEELIDIVNRPNLAK